MRKTRWFERMRKEKRPKVNQSKKPSIDLTIHQKPIFVRFTCIKCLKDIDIPYQMFIEKYGSPCYWIGQEIYCPACGTVYEIDEWDCL